jgi:hypothetical protein
MAVRWHPCQRWVPLPQRVSAHMEPRLWVPTAVGVICHL